MISNTDPEYRKSHTGKDSGPLLLSRGLAGDDDVRHFVRFS